MTQWSKATYYKTSLISEMLKWGWKCAFQNLSTTVTVLITMNKSYNLRLSFYIYKIGGWWLLRSLPIYNSRYHLYKEQSEHWDEESEVSRTPNLRKHYSQVGASPGWVPESERPLKSYTLAPGFLIPVGPWWRKQWRIQTICLLEFLIKIFYNDLFTFNSNFFQLLLSFLQRPISLPWSISLHFYSLSSFSPFLFF